VRENLLNFSIEQQINLKQLLVRPELHTSIVSGSGFFRIHYDTSGINTPKYIGTLPVHENAVYAADAIDSSYNFEVEYLGYPAPPSDFGEGGDDLYDIYILSSNNYGSTTPENVINEQQQTYTSYIEIHPEFGNEFYTHGIDAMQVTLAHELHHAIQLGNYTKRINLDLFFYELTSTSMEEFVFDTVNDYYGYNKNYFNSPVTPLSSTDGYSSATWNIYLRDNFGYDIIKRQWEMMPTTRAMFAINNALFEHGSTFTKEFNKFAIWIYYTNYRSVPGTYFEEAEYYPAVKMTMILDYYQGLPASNGNPKAASHNYLKYVIPVEGASYTDTLISIITNGDVQNAVNNSSTNFPYEYELFNNSTSGERYLTENYSSTFSVQNSALWSVSEILNDLIVRSDTTVTGISDISGSFIFPNPFRYGIDSYINISLNSSGGDLVDFNFYTSGMELIISSQISVQGLPINNSFGIRWYPQDKSGKKLASGVYIYAIQKGDEIFKGKVVIFN
jgi:hypothetical protein